MNIVSLIIPMYNEQNNVKNCVDILKKQKDQRFNVLFVDDGSTDNTIKYLKEALDKEIEFEYNIISQDNKGAAEARRNGIEKSKTEFIMIYDCDDKLSDNLIEEIYLSIGRSQNVDIIIPEMYVEDNSGKWNVFKFYSNSNELNPEECLINSLNGWKVHGCFAVKKSIIMKSYEQYALYNMNDENYTNNDEVITRFSYTNSKKIVRCKAIYYYCYNINSTTKSVNSRRYLAINNAFILNNYYSDTYKLKSEVYGEVVIVLWSTFLYMVKNKSKLDNIDEWSKSIKNGVKELKFIEYYNAISLKNKIKLVLLKANSLFL